MESEQLALELRGRTGTGVCGTDVSAEVYCIPWNKPKHRYRLEVKVDGVTMSHSHYPSIGKAHEKALSTMRAYEVQSESPEAHRRRVFNDLLDNFRLVNELPHLVLCDIVSAEVEARARESHP
jgi:hypothetical protein